MSYLGASDIVYSDVIGSFHFSDIAVQINPGSLRPGAKDPGP